MIRRPVIPRPRPRLRLRLAATVAVLAAVAGSLGACGGPGQYTFSAVFTNGQGVFPGSHVQILGLDVGDVTGVHNEGDHVVVTMSVPDDHPVPAGVHAIIIAPELLGQRSVDLEPGYTGGPRLRTGARIPLSRTSTPVETNTILNEFTHYMEQINPKNVHDVVVNLAQLLNGQGDKLNALIGHAAGTIQLLADKGTELGQMNGTLAKLTGTLDSRTAGIAALIRDYDTVSGVIAADRQQLDGAIRALSDASTQLAGLLSPNLTGIQHDIGVLTTAGRTIDRNLDSVDAGVAASVKLFSAAHRAYDANRHWLNLNNQSPPGTPAMVLQDEVRDRLAGVCRRVLAHHSQGLSADQIATLTKCGNPYSGFFDPLLGQVQTTLNQLSGGSSAQAAPPSPQQLLQQGLAQIPGLTPQQQSQLSQPTVPVPTTSSTTSTTVASPPSTLLPPLSPPPSLGSPGLFGAVVGGLGSFGRHLAGFFGGWL